MKIPSGPSRRTAAGGLLALAVLAVLASACARKPKDIRVSPARTTIYGLKRTLVMSAIVVDTKGHEIPGPELKWDVDKPAVATVDAKSGVVTSVKPGRCTVKATYQTLTGHASLEVVDAASITISPLRMTLAGPAGVKGRFLADVKSSKEEPVSTARPRWTSSDLKVAAVDGEGIVTSVGPGRSTITASLGDIANSADLIVTSRVVVQFDASPKTLILRVKDAQRITPLALDEAGKEIENVAVEWVSSDPRTATVANGLVTGIAPGTATIRATAGARTAEVSVLVN